MTSEAKQALGRKGDGDEDEAQRELDLNDEDGDDAGEALTA
jgi:hypothetical protein